ANLDALGFGFAEAGFVYDDLVGAWGQEGSHEIAVSAGGKFADDGVGARVDDLYFRAADGGSGGVHHRAADSSGGAALAVRAPSEEGGGEQKHYTEKSMNYSHYCPPSPNYERKTLPPT